MESPKKQAAEPAEPPKNPDYSVKKENVQQLPAFVPPMMPTAPYLPSPYVQYPMYPVGMDPLQAQNWLVQQQLQQQMAILQQQHMKMQTPQMFNQFFQGPPIYPQQQQQQFQQPQYYAEQQVCVIYTNFQTVL